MVHWILLVILISLLCLVIGITAVFMLRKRLSANRWTSLELDNGDLNIPVNDDIHWNDASSHLDDVIQHYTEMDLGSWNAKNKEIPPRIILAKLKTADDEDSIDEVNTYLRSMSPWGTPGSKWLLNRKGDYDFAMCGLVTVLHLFGDDDEMLNSESSEHIVKNLIGLDASLPITDRVPRTRGMFRESENHILMTVSSFYLAAKWAYDQGMEVDEDYLQDLEDESLRVIEDLGNPGPHEFNSRPYFGYTMAALLNLEAFGSEIVMDFAREVLDRYNFCYALSSLSLRRYPPFRRRVCKARKRSLTMDGHSAMMQMWVSFQEDVEENIIIESGHEHAIIAGLLPYRPPEIVMSLLFGKDPGYFVKMGHGKGSSPEIYSAGPGYLLSSGGTSRDIISRIIARPTCLILDDGKTEEKDLLWVSGPGIFFWNRNNTGVHDRFAVSRGRVRIPENWKPIAQNDFFLIFEESEVTIAVHSRFRLGIICILDMDPDEALEALTESNSSRSMLKRKFTFPNGRIIEYDLRSKKKEGVIVSVDGIHQNRDLDAWPLLDGVIH